MKITMGPVLSFREAIGDRWNVSALVIAAKGQLAVPMSASFEAEVSPPTVLMSHKGETVLRYDFSVKRAAAAQQIDYGFPDQTWSFHVPALIQSPKMAFASCNGFSNPKDMKNVEEKNALWAHLQTLHDDEKYDVLIMGGGSGLCRSDMDDIRA